jgi:hypothetical protein
MVDLADKRPLRLAWTVRRMGESQGKLKLDGGNELTCSSLSSSTSGPLYSASTS